MRIVGIIQMGYDERRAKRREVQRRRKRRQFVVRVITILIVCTVCFAGIVGITRLIRDKKLKQAVNEIPKTMKIVEEKPDIQVELLDVNEYSRPGETLNKVKGIVIHYTANPGTTAIQNRNYFQGLKDSKETYASSHFVVGIDGEVIQCIPCNEISYASNDRNADTIAIECCIPDDTGQFSDNTYQSVIQLTAWLMGRYGLNMDDVIRHYDITEKVCPKYYVENEDAWIQMKEDIKQYINENGVEKSVGEATE